MVQAIEAEPRAPDQPAAEGFHIVAFCCHFCAYAAADLAGALRVQSPPSVRIVKLPCTGKVDILLLLQALEHGADGIMVAGCMEGDCHYQRGNLHARQRVERVQELVAQVGLEPERLKMFNMSSGMGQAWADAVTDMDARIRELGPSPLRPTERGGHDHESESTGDESGRVTSSASPGRPGA